VEQARVSHWLQGNRTVEEDTEDEGDRSRDGEQSADDIDDDVEHSADGEDQDDYEQQLLNDDKGAESDWILIGYW